MPRRPSNKQGASMIEYVILVTLIIAVLFVMQFYISRAFHGRWKSTGDSFGMGRQYQAGQAIDCTYAQINAGFGVWYDSDCYQRAATLQCAPGDIACENAQKQICAGAYCQPDKQ